MIFAARISTHAICENFLCEPNEKGPKDFEQLLGIPGLGPKSLRALSLAAELIYAHRTGRGTRLVSPSHMEEKIASPSP